MSSTAPVAGASELIAAFAAASHAGETFAEARRTAAARLAAARMVLEAPAASAERAARALASNGSVLRRAFAGATALAAVSATQSDAATVAAAIAAGEAAGLDDAEVVDAIAVGREVAARVRVSIALDEPWDVEAVADRIGAALGAARIARLDAAQMRHALGLAATQAVGLGVAHGTVSEELARGKAAFDAIEGAALARAGFTSAPASLEGRRGLVALMAHGFDAPALCEGLGQRWISAR
jgi:2-methylcitrate dehydratase PrpD